MSKKRETYKEAVEELERIVMEIEDENIEVDMLTEKSKKGFLFDKVLQKQA